MSIRQEKIQRLLLKELSIIFQQQSSILFGGRFITVSAVKVTPDLSVAKVYLSFMASQDKKADLKAVNGYNWKVRKLLAEKVGKSLRIVPELFFKIDDSLDISQEIDRLLK